jgi:hypothetical protein
MPRGRRARRAADVNAKIENFVQVFFTRDFMRLAVPEIAHSKAQRPIQLIVVAIFFRPIPLAARNDYRDERKSVMRSLQCCNAQFYIALQHICPLKQNTMPGAVPPHFAQRGRLAPCLGAEPDASASGFFDLIHLRPRQGANSVGACGHCALGDGLLDRFAQFLGLFLNGGQLGLHEFRLHGQDFRGRGSERASERNQKQL